MFVCTFRYRPKHVACYLCTEYKQKQGCTLPVCPWLAERIEAGVVGYQEAVMATIPRNRLLAPRLRALVASFPGSLWKDGTHKERMEYAKTRLHYYRRRDTPAFYAALFLLTSSAELWKRSANCFYRKGFEPAYAVLGGISPHDYALILAAKGLYRGVGGPATMELADPDIVDAEVFRMIVNATLIARYGLPVLDIRARRARV